MRFNHKTRNLLKYLHRLPTANGYYLGLPLTEIDSTRLTSIGLPGVPSPGDSVLPPASGPASRRNAHGYKKVRRDLPMETAYRTVQWSWTEYHGRDSIERTDWRDVPYKRYPRTDIPAYGVELHVQQRQDGALFVVAGPFTLNAADEARLTNTGNMLIEQLGTFEVLDSEFSSWSPVPVRRLNWDVLPAGRRPWPATRLQLEEIVRSVRAGNRTFAMARFDAVGAHEPDFAAIGRGGFRGYVAFGFESRRLCVLENATINNATYVLPLDTWERLSQMTKADLLDSGLHRGRLVHSRSWFGQLNALLRGAGSAAA